MDFMIFGLSASVVIKRLVNLLKKIGVQGKWCLVAAIACGGALFAMREVAAMYPEYERWFLLGFGTLSAAMWASEFYDQEQAGVARALQALSSQGRRTSTDASHSHRYLG